jgi:DNA repair exonuclease SbcCD nuclease subunit
MNPPVLVVSDIQFHTYKAHSRLIDGVNSRLLDQINAWRQAVEVGLREGCKLLLIPGDVFEIRGSIKPSVFNRVTALLMETMTKGFNIGIIAGNHDMEHFEAGESAVDSWDYLRAGSGAELKGCTVFKTPGLHHLGGYKVLGIPYIHDLDAFKETFARLSELMTPEITMIHQGLDNFNTDGAYPWTGLTAEWLEEHNPGIILCGHYHRPGLSRSGRVVNVGALVQHRFSDEGSDRGCWIVSEAGKKFVKIDSPPFITADGRQRIGQECRGAFVRIRATSPNEAEALRKEAEDAGALSIVVEIEKEFKTAHEKTISMASPRKMLTEYLDLIEKYKDHKSKIIDLFDRVCSR